MKAKSLFYFLLGVFTYYTIKNHTKEEHIPMPPPKVVNKEYPYKVPHKEPKTKGLNQDSLARIWDPNNLHYGSWESEQKRNESLDSWADYFAD